MSNSHDPGECSAEPGPQSPDAIQMRLKKIGDLWFVQIFGPSCHHKQQFCGWEWRTNNYHEHGEGGRATKEAAIAEGTMHVSSLKGMMIRHLGLWSEEGWEHLDTSAVEGERRPVAEPPSFFHQLFPNLREDGQPIKRKPS